MKIAFNGLKKVLEVYDFSIDQTLDSVNTELVSNEATTPASRSPIPCSARRWKRGPRWSGSMVAGMRKDTIDKLKQRDTGKAAVAPAASGG